MVSARKIGLTSKVMQDAVGITEPDHGVIYDDMFFARRRHDPVRSRFIAPRLEVELAFVLGRDLSGPGCTLDDVLDATDYVTPAIEILDARIQMTDPETGSTRTIVDTVSDNAADAGIVVGAAAVRARELDLPWVSAVLRAQRRDRGVGRGGCCARPSGHGVAWLADRLAGTWGHAACGSADPGRLVHPSDLGAARRRVRGGLRAARDHRVPLRLRRAGAVSRTWWRPRPARACSTNRTTSSTSRSRTSTPT